MKGPRHAVRRRRVAVGTTPPAPCQLSRYPTRTAPAVPGQVDTRLQQLWTAPSLPRAAGAPLPCTGLDHVSGHVWPIAGSLQVAPQGPVAAEIAGGRGRWPR